MVLNIPTALTWLRIVLIPVFVGIYYVPQEWLTPVMANWIGMSVFALAAITDWLDGYLARRLGATSGERRSRGADPTGSGQLARTRRNHL